MCKLDDKRTVYYKNYLKLGEIIMAREIEIEFKNLLTQDEFDKLKSYFHLKDSQFHSQTNYYFETPSFEIKNLGGALRIRQKSQSFTLTLKLKQAIGHLEIHQSLNEIEAKNMIKSSTLPDGEVKQYLSAENIDLTKLDLIGELKTNRVEIPYHDGLLVLDHSTYLNNEDFELEYEVKDEIIGEEHFLTLLKMQGIPVRKTLNKIKRFFNAKQKLIGE